MRDGIGVEGLDSRDEPPPLEEPGLVFDPGRGELVAPGAEVLGNSRQESVKAWVSHGCRRCRHQSIMLVTPGTFEDLDESKRQPQSSSFVAFGQATSNLNGNINDARAHMRHGSIVEAGGSTCGAKELPGGSGAGRHWPSLPSLPPARRAVLGPQDRQRGGRSVKAGSGGGGVSSSSSSSQRPPYWSGVSLHPRTGIGPSGANPNSSTGPTGQPFLDEGAAALVIDLRE